MKLRDTINKIISSPRLAPWLIVAAVIAVAMRFIPRIINCITADMKFFLLKWVSTIDTLGVDAYSTPFSDYSPLYTYMLGLVSLLPPDLWAPGIKTLSILGDVLLATGVGLIVSTVSSHRTAIVRHNLSLLASTIILWLPSVIINSAVWGQCDVFWAGSCIFALLYFIKDKPFVGMIWMGIAISFKLQSMFFAPVILMLVFARKIRWWYVLIVPVIYLLTCLPCVIAGREMIWILKIYAMQGTKYENWSLNAPSFYNLLNDVVPYSRIITYTLLTGVSVITLALCWWIARRYERLDKINATRLILIFTAFCGVFYPLVLPMMHERYMYLGDVASVLAAVAVIYDSRLWLSAGATQIASIIALRVGLWYISYLTPLVIAACFATIAVVLLFTRMNSISKSHSNSSGVGQISENG